MVLKNVINECLWDKMTSYLREFSENVTLADLIEEYRKSSPDSAEPMYYI